MGDGRGGEEEKGRRAAGEGRERAGWGGWEGRRGGGGEMREAGAKGQTKRKGGHGGEREEGRRQKQTARRGSRKEAPKAGVILHLGCTEED